MTERITSPACIASKPSLICSKADAPRDPVVQVQAALQVEIDEARHVDAEPVGAHRATLQPALAEQGMSGQLDFLVVRHHADDGGGAARGKHPKRLLGGRLQGRCTPSAWCTPPPVISMIRSTGSPSPALTRSVAPSFVAASSLAGFVSTAMMRPAPAT